MTCAVLSVGSNLGDRLAMLQSVLDGLGGAVRVVSPVYETQAWGGVSQGAFLNAVLIVEDSEVDARGWLARAQELEQAAERVREQRWGPRTLDVDVISCHDAGGTELTSDDEQLTLPHPLAHQRAFVLVPWHAVDAQAVLTVAGRGHPVADLLNALAPAERDGVRLTDLVLQRRQWPSRVGKH